MKISVIVPVYKVEKYLDRCILSLVNQSYVDLEIILVDDGSPDACPHKCDDWAKKDKRIKVIHKVNEGLGNARNSGMKMATGDWISFVDSDDYLNLHTYERCMRCLKETNADVCYFSSITVKHNEEIINKSVFPNTLEENEIRKELLPKTFGRYDEDKYNIGSACMGIYRRKFIEQNDIFFYSEKELISEDHIFTTDVCSLAHKITFLNEPFYYYCMNDSSLSHSYRKDRYEKIVIYYKNRINKIQELALEKEAKSRAGVNYWSMVIGCLKQEIKSNEITFKKKIERIHQICENDISQELVNKNVFNHINLSKKLLLVFIKNRFVYLVYILIKIKCMYESANII